MDLFKIDFEITPDSELFFQKMSYLFLQKPPVDQHFYDYVRCLEIAQSEMMELIYDPRNKYLVMEDNPIDSIDPMHGVPDKFK